MLRSAILAAVVIVVTEVEVSACFDQLATTPARRVAGLDEGFVSGSERLMLGSVSTFSGGTAVAVVFMATCVAASGWVGGECAGWAGAATPKAGTLTGHRAIR